MCIARILQRILFTTACAPLGGDHEAMNVFQNDHIFVTVHLKGLKCFSFLVGDALDNCDTNQASSTENDNEAVVEDAKQTHPHHEEEISDDDVGISDPDYTPSFEESYEGVIKDHPELKEIKVKHRNTLLQGTHKWSPSRRTLRGKHCHRGYRCQMSRYHG